MIQLLKSELTQRMKKNSRYSMRAFAKSLDINIGALSGLLNGKRKMTAKSAEQLCNKLGISPVKKSEIILGLLREDQISPSLDRIEIEEKIFQVASEWYHWAILQLVRTDIYLESPQHSHPRWIAKKLDITELEAKLAVERLLDLNLLSRDKSGYLKRSPKNITTANKNVTSSALKKWQKQIREKAIVSMENDPLEVRSMTSITMAIDPEKIAEARILIDEFQERLSEFLEQGKKKKVFQLCVSLYPLQK